MSTLKGQEAFPSDGRIETIAMDKGFDSAENVLGAYERGVGALVPPRDVPENLEKQPREDREEPAVPGGNVIYDRYSGEVFCYETPENANQAPLRRQMNYAGFDADRDAHKFRCPLGGRAATQCTAYGICRDRHPRRNCSRSLRLSQRLR